jgi:prevent-host-death family protein
MANPILPPQEVGVRALKNGLSRYLAAVRDGQELIVTVHGKPVARIVPVSRSIERLAELVAQGKVLPPHPGPRYIPKPIEGAGPVSDLVIEQRR